MSEISKWCDFDIRIINRDQEKKNAVAILYQFLKGVDAQRELRVQQKKRYGFMEHWLGDLLIEIGIPYANEEDGIAFKPKSGAPCVCPCKGSLDNYELFTENGLNALDIWTACQYSPMDEIWEEVFRYLGIQNDILISYWGQNDTFNEYYGTSAELDGEDTRFIVEVAKMPEDAHDKLINVLDNSEMSFVETDSLKFGAIAEKFYNALVEAPEFPDIECRADAEHSFYDWGGTGYEIDLGGRFRPEQLATRADMAFLNVEANAEA